MTLDSFTKITPMGKSLSGDERFYAETADGKYMLRLSDAAKHEYVETAFIRMKQVYALGIPMPRLVDFGVCNDGKNIYMLSSWVEGENLDPILPALPESEQFAIGLKAGEILRKIHTLPAPEYRADWLERYEIRGKMMNWFLTRGVQGKYEENKIILKYYEDNRHLLRGRPQCFIHQDYYTYNFMLAENQEISVIDWEIGPYGFGGYGDPWIEFCGINHSRFVPRFVTGMIRGYFGGDPPEDFWPLFALYISVHALALIAWNDFNPEEIHSDEPTVKDILQWFDDMRNPVPAWYVRYDS